MCSRTTGPLLASPLAIVFCPPWPTAFPLHRFGRTTNTNNFAVACESAEIQTIFPTAFSLHTFIAAMIRLFTSFMHRKYFQLINSGPKIVSSFQRLIRFSVHLTSSVSLILLHSHSSTGNIFSTSNAGLALTNYFGHVAI